MKGLNTARIAALATMVALGASVVHAGSVYFSDLGNDPIIDSKGAPAAKIVVGNAAQVTDGIAAANIAAALAQYTYGTSKVTATPTGLEGVACSAAGADGGSSAGSCEVTDKKVTIEITVPGQLANAHQFKTLITDWVDKALGNRQMGLSEDMYSADTATSDTSQLLSPLRGAYGNSQTAFNLYRIGENEFSPFSNDKNTPVRDEQATSEFTYTAEQGFWVGAGTNSTSSTATGTYFDSNAAYRQVIARPNIVAYNVRFLGNDYGIPVCTATNTSGLWARCKSDTDSTARHRVAIPFLGQKWVISELTVPVNDTSSRQLANSNGVINGGKIKLAKEADYRIISIGEQIDAGTFKVRLADISVAVGSTNTHPAIMDVLDSNDQVVGQIQVTPGDTYTFTQSSTGNSIKVHVYQTAGGLTLSAKWAEIAIYTDEIVLEDGKRYNNAASDDSNWKNIYASLLWKNRDGSSSDNEADSLREIVLYVDDITNYMGGENRMKAGDSIVFPKKDSQFRLTYNGLDLGDGDYVSLNVRSDSGRVLTYGTYGGSWDCNTKNSTYSASFIKLWSDKDGAFGGTSSDLLGNDRSTEIYIDPIGTGGTNISSGQNASSTLNWYPLVFWKPAGCSYYKYTNASLLNYASAGTRLNIGKAVLSSYTGKIKFDAAGDDSAAPGVIDFYFATNGTAFNATSTSTYSANFTATSPSVIGEIVLQEDAGKNNATSHQGVQIRMPVYNLTSGDWRFKNADSSTATIYYTGINLSVGAGGSSGIGIAGSYELPFVTERGSKVTDVSLTGVTMKVAKKVGQPMFTFATASSTLGEESSDSWIAKEGDTKTLSNGVKLKVKSIDVKVGSCTASVKDGGAASCTVTGKNGVGAVADPDMALVPYFKSPSELKGMVIKDTDSDAKSASAVRISVGGPAVNSLTMDVMNAAEMNNYFESQNTLVKAFGKTIVVAGKSGDDTMAAANDFISKLKTQ